MIADFCTSTKSRNSHRRSSKMGDCRVITEIRNLQKEMLNLSESLQEFSDHVCSENYVNVYDEIVDGSVTTIGTSNYYRIPKMYQVESLFGRLQCLAVAHNLFSAKEIKDIEAKLGRKMDKFDTIYVKRPNEAGLQTLLVIRLVKHGDVVFHKL